MSNINKKTWKEFKESGLLWFINTTLHVFGWAIAVDVDKEGNITEAYPARVKFRGFREQSNEDGYRNVTAYLKDTVDELVEETATELVEETKEDEAVNIDKSQRILNLILPLNTPVEHWLPVFPSHFDMHIITDRLEQSRISYDLTHESLTQRTYVILKATRFVETKICIPPTDMHPYGSYINVKVVPAEFYPVKYRKELIVTPSSRTITTTYTVSREVEHHLAIDVQIDNENISVVLQKVEGNKITVGFHIDRIDDVKTANVKMFYRPFMKEPELLLEQKLTIKE